MEAFFLEWREMEHQEKIMILTKFVDDEADKYAEMLRELERDQERLKIKTDLLDDDWMEEEEDDEVEVSLMPTADQKRLNQLEYDAAQMQMFLDKCAVEKRQLDREIKMYTEEQEMEEKRIDELEKVFNKRELTVHDDFFDQDEESDNLLIWLGQAHDVEGNEEGEDSEGEEEKETGVWEEDPEFLDESMANLDDSVATCIEKGPSLFDDFKAAGLICDDFIVDNHESVKEPIDDYYMEQTDLLQAIVEMGSQGIPEPRLKGETNIQPSVGKEAEDISECQQISVSETESLVLPHNDPTEDHPKSCQVKEATDVGDKENCKDHHLLAEVMPETITEAHEVSDIPKFPERKKNRRRSSFFQEHKVGIAVAAGALFATGVGVWQIYKKH